MRGRRRVIHRHDGLPVANAAKRHIPLAVLHWLGSISWVQLAARARNAASRLRYQVQCLRIVELPRDHQHGVVGLIILAVKRGQPIDGHVFYIRARTDCRLAVVVPQIRRCHHALTQHAIRTVLAAFEFVAHHCHLRIEHGLVHL